MFSNNIGNSMKILPLPEHNLQAQPEGFYEHLMQPDDFTSEDTTHIMIVQRALQDMPPDMYEVMLAIYSERIPYSQLGKRLGCSKTQAWRKAQQVNQWVRDKLLNEPLLKARYGMIRYWEDAARMCVESFDRCTHVSCDAENIRFCARKMRDAVSKGEDIPMYAFTTIGTEAVHALRELNKWDAEEMIDLLCKKQADYGHENILAFGLVGVAVRMHDKIARLENLLNNKKEPANETIVDTYMDLVGYATIADMLINKLFQMELNPNKENK